MSEEIQEVCFIDKTLRQLIEQTLQAEGVECSNDIKSDIGHLIGLYQGYRQAYQTHSETLGYLRQVAAPVIREKAVSELPELHWEFLGRIGLWLDQPKCEENCQNPSIFLITLPKSGTVYVSHSLSRTLGYDHTSTLVTPTFPKNIIWGGMLLDFLKGNMVSVSHLQPDSTNAEILSRCKIKIILHIRDPRAALLSWIHFVGKSFKATASPTALNNLEFFIESSFAHLVNWIEGWMSVLAVNPQLEALILTHEELSENPELYFKKIFTFYGLGSPELKLADKTEATHFRSGDNAEWRTVFPAYLVTKMNDQIPESLWLKFGWSR